MICDNCDTREICERNLNLAEPILPKQVCRNKEYKTAEEYRQRMIQAFHNADCDYLIAVCCLPTEKEFEHLEWLLKTELKEKKNDN